jgi:hypothetical protein
MALVAVAAILLILVIIKQKAGPPPSEELDASGTQAAVGQSFAVPEASGLDIYRGKDRAERVTLTKDASGLWTISNRFKTRARTESVQTLLDHLSDLRGELRSEDPALLKDYSIQDENAFHFEVTGSSGQVLAHRLLSPMRPRGTQNFVRENGSDKVVITYTDLLSDIGIFSDTDQLEYKIAADLRPAGIDSSQVSSMELTPPGKKKLTFTKSQEKDKPAVWSLAEDASAVVDETQLQSFFASIFNLYGLETADPTGREKDFQGSWIRIVSGSSDMAQTHELSLGRKDAAKATQEVRAQDGLVYEIPQAQLDALLQKTKESFLKKT